MERKSKLRCALLAASCLSLLLAVACDKYKPPGDPEPPRGPMPTNENPTDESLKKGPATPSVPARP